MVNQYLSLKIKYQLMELLEIILSMGIEKKEDIYKNDYLLNKIFINDFSFFLFLVEQN
jgi:hypothetical protein